MLNVKLVSLLGSSAIFATFVIGFSVGMTTFGWLHEPVAKIVSKSHVDPLSIEIKRITANLNKMSNDVDRSSTEIRQVTAKIRETTESIRKERLWLQNNDKTKEN